MTKIAFFSVNFPPENGAASLRVARMVNILHANDFSIKVFTALPNYPTGSIFSDYRGKLYTKELINNIETYRYWIYPAHGGGKFARMAAMFSFALSSFFAIIPLLKYRPEIVIVQSPPLLGAFTSLIISKIIGAKFVLNVSDLWPRAMQDLSALKNSFILHFFKWIEKQNYTNADLLIGQSEEILEHISLFTQKEKTLYRSGVDTLLVKEKVFEQDFSKKTLKLVYAGVLGMAQGVYDVCKNIDFQQLNIEFHIYGEGSERPKITRWLEQNTHSNVFYHGYVPQNEIYENLQQYDVALVCQKAKIYGTVPSKLYQAMAAGLPIIYIGNGEAANFIRQFESGFICQPNDFHKLAEVIQEIQQLSLDTLQKISQRNRKAAFDFFDNQIFNENLVKALKKVSFQSQQ